MTWNLAVIGPEAAFPRVLRQGGQAGPDRPGPAGVVSGAVQPPNTVIPAHNTPWSSTAGPFLIVGSSQQLGGWLGSTPQVYPPGVPMPNTRPVPVPVPVHTPVHYLTLLVHAVLDTV